MGLEADHVCCGLVLGDNEICGNGGLKRDTRTLTFELANDVNHN